MPVIITPRLLSASLRMCTSQCINRTYCFTALASGGCLNYDDGRFVRLSPAVCSSQPSFDLHPSKTTTPLYSTLLVVRFTNTHTGRLRSRHSLSALFHITGRQAHPYNRSTHTPTILDHAPATVASKHNARAQGSLEEEGKDCRKCAR